MINMEEDVKKITLLRITIKDKENVKRQLQKMKGQQPRNYLKIKVKLVSLKEDSLPLLLMKDPAMHKEELKSLILEHQ